MILQTSLFNKGIYKSTLRRYAWGSILYFIMLFLFTGMMILLNEDPDIVNRWSSIRGSSTLLSGEYMVFPMLISTVVPSVAGLLIFRSIHSKKNSVFIHSLPVKRSANYISSVLSALTLMIAPIVLNTAVLMIISAAGYSMHFTFADCITWMLLNIFCIFVMFSAVCFVATLTGNSFAMVGLNVLFHCVPLVLAAAFTVVCEMFLYGFAGESVLLENVFNNIFVTRVPAIMTNWIYASDKVMTGYIIDIVIFLIVSLVLYIIGGILYNRRKMETVEDVAGFKCLNYIFKHFVTFIGAIGAFAIFCYSIYDNATVLWITVLTVSAVIYFGTEMILKKTLRVWRSYKGYIAFVAGFAIIMCLFAFTDLFGFESRMPEKNDVKSVAVYEYYRNEKPVTSSEELIDEAYIIHNEMIEKRNIIPDEEYDTRIHIEYNLRNGKTVHRVYQVNEDKLQSIMNSLYEHKEYKEKREEIYTPMSSVYSFLIQPQGNQDTVVLEENQRNELVECIKKDMDKLSYSQINAEGWNFSVEINYVPARENDMIINGTVLKEQAELRTRSAYIGINSNFTDTINWIKENGYWSNISIKNNGTMYIARSWRELPFFDEEGRLVEEEIEKDTCIKIKDKSEMGRIIDFAYKKGKDYIPEKEKITVFHVNEYQDKDYSIIAVMTKEQLKEILQTKDIDKILK